jgi:ABC-type amino acid transport substrate-binding protein
MNVITRLLPLCITILLLAASCGTKPPADELEAIKYTGTIRVGTSADAPPFESLDDQGHMTGFDIDLVNEIGKRMGVAVEFHNMSYEELIPAVQEGEIDIAIAALNAKDGQNQNIGYTDAYINLEEGTAAVQLTNRPSLNGGQLAIAVPGGAVELIKALNKTLADMSADGFIEDLSKEYLLTLP